MQIIKKMKETEFLGREFILWLWFRSEIKGGVFDLGEGDRAELWLAGKMTLCSDTDRGTDTMTCSGSSAFMREARFALADRKTIKKAAVKLTFHNSEWAFVIDSEWMNFRSFKTPPVIQNREEDPEGLFYEKVLLTEQAVKVMDRILGLFIKIRLSSDWEEEELPAMKKWINEGKDLS